MKRIFVVDAGVLFSNWPDRNPVFNLMTTEKVINEIHNHPSRARAENLISVGRLRIDVPSLRSINRVKIAAKETGDITVLSDNDIELIAIALDCIEQYQQVIVVSTDFAVLNTASHLGLGILDSTNRMRDRRRWILVCPACKHIETVPPASLECPICGTIMRRRVRNRRQLET